MKYLLDTNSVANELLKKRGDFFIIRDVLSESPRLREKEIELRSFGVTIVEVTIKQLRKLKEVVLFDHCGNLKLIRLYTNMGMADVLMLAYILSETEQEGLFPPEPWTLVTKDAPLSDAAKKYDIECVSADLLVKTL